jgi:hypothetical protein
MIDTAKLNKIIKDYLILMYGKKGYKKIIQDKKLSRLIKGHVDKWILQQRQSSFPE